MIVILIDRLRGVLIVLAILSDMIYSLTEILEASIIGIIYIFSSTRERES